MFCNQCGFNVGDTSKFCSNCGAPVAQAVQPAPVQPAVAAHVPSVAMPAAPTAPTVPSPPAMPVYAAQGTATLRIQMESQPFLIKIGKMEVLMDGQVISKDLWFGKTIELVVNQMGQHTLQISLKNIVTRRSEVLGFQISPGQVLNFEGIYSNFTGGVNLVQM